MATYSGDANFAGATSSAAVVAVSADAFCSTDARSLGDDVARWITRCGSVRTSSPGLAIWPLIGLPFRLFHNIYIRYSNDSTLTCRHYFAASKTINTIRYARAPLVSGGVGLHWVHDQRQDFEYHIKIKMQAFASESLIHHEYPPANELENSGSSSTSRLSDVLPRLDNQSTHRTLAVDERSDRREIDRRTDTAVFCFSRPSPSHERRKFRDDSEIRSYAPRHFASKDHRAARRVHLSLRP